MWLRNYNTFFYGKTITVLNMDFRYANICTERTMGEGELQ